MASLKQLKDRISGVKSTKKITQAMKVVAAAKLKKARKAFEANKEYIEQMNIVSDNVFSQVTDKTEFPMIFTSEKPVENTLVIVFGSDKGLCGGFNSGLVRHLKSKVSSIPGKKKILCVGKKIYDVMKSQMGSVELYREAAEMDIDAARELTISMVDRFNLGELDHCVAFYNEFVSSITQKNTSKQLIPLFSNNSEEQKEEGKKEEKILFENEPSFEKMADGLASSCITANVFSMLLESASGEHGARMAAMDNANRNAQDIIKKVTVQYNRMRQSAVTNELIEIISGMEAISKN
jgi:F-type H+-transporting ATPase subunit gamma